MDKKTLKKELQLIRNTINIVTGLEDEDEALLQYAYEAVGRLIESLAEQPAQQQEPVAWMWKDGTVTADPDRADGTWTPLYKSPPAKPWVSLTDEERRELRKRNQQHDAFAKAIDAALKEKNNG